MVCGSDYLVHLSGPSEGIDGMDPSSQFLLSFKILAMHLIKSSIDQDGERLLRARLGEMVVG